MTVALTPRPADFDDHAFDTVPSLCLRYGVGKSVVNRWRIEFGAVQHRTSVRKDDYERIRELIASGLSAEKVGAMVGCGRKAIIASVAKHGLGPWRNSGGFDQRPCPDDFTEQFAKMSVEALSDHYSAGHHTVRRWAKERGVTRPVGYNGQARSATRVRQAKVPSVKALGVKPAKAAPKLVAHHPTAMLSRNRDMSPAGQAADYLRQFGAVWRCTETGRPDPAGKCWRRGSAVLSDAEIIERADWMRNRRMAA